MASTAIFNRKSIRKFQTIAIPAADLHAILRAGGAAPSSKNKQPWKFVIVTNTNKQMMLQAMERGLAAEQTERKKLPNSADFLQSAERTMKIMEQAPINIFIFNTDVHAVVGETLYERRVRDTVNIQAIGAAIQNMLLVATERGIGSLWNCDILFAKSELSTWLDIEGDLIASVALGYPQQNPFPRPRKKVAEIMVLK